MLFEHLKKWVEEKKKDARVCIHGEETVVFDSLRKMCVKKERKIM